MRGHEAIHRVAVAPNDPSHPWLRLASELGPVPAIVLGNSLAVGDTHAWYQARPFPGRQKNRLTVVVGTQESSYGILPLGLARRVEHTFLDDRNFLRTPAYC